MPAPDDLRNLDSTGFDALYGMHYEEATAQGCRARVEIDDRHLQPMGLVHGGLYAAMAESMASVGTWLGNPGKFVAGLSNQTSFLRPVFEGDTVHAVATPRHTGRTTWIWEVELTNGEGKGCALVRVTIAVREPRD